MVNELTLVAVETASIQSYIFNSNRLRENVGASYLVAAATGDWALECVRQIAPDQHNVVSDGQSYKPDHVLPHIGETSSKLQVEVLYAGGGNFVGLFARADLARDFARKLSQKVICEAPGLRITIHSMSFNWAKESLCTAVGDLLKALKNQRSHQPASLGLGGLGVTAMCDSTSLPAVGKDPKDPEEGKIYSAEVLAKRQIFETADARLQTLLPDPAWGYPRDFDDLGRTKGEMSYIAVVHADGNDMGLLMQGLHKKFPTAAHNSEYITYMRNFSENVKLAAQAALGNTIYLLINAVESGQVNHLDYDEDGRLLLPFRPLVSGGDDITFVCDGRIGIALALEFIRQFEIQTELFHGTRLTACAGIAIVKAHYPFARAYALADDLCGSAKKFRKAQQAEEHSAIDWHFTAGGLYGELEDDIRAREYQVKPGRLTLRPVFTTSEAHDYRTWPVIEQSLYIFQEHWHEHRSKAKALIDALRDGPEHTKLFDLRYLKNTGLLLPDVAGFAQTFGWQDGTCGYYDALELMDLFTPIYIEEVTNG